MRLLKHLPITLQDGSKIEPVNWKETTSSWTMEKLLKHDEILYYEELDLYEDEMADNGITRMSIKLRVMPGCFLLLLR